MLITKVELKNIKSYTEAVFEFEPGTTAITGENGIGKTTIIEAIAWALFDLLGYKKDEFLKRGQKKGSVRVTFRSSADEREYLVYRDTGTDYYVYDPVLKVRIAEKKEDVTRFLWQHLGVEPGTDLETLFKHAIGVPQGTFTAIFLSTAAERKRTFDILLKVEEYRRSAEELLKTTRYLESGINDVKVKIVRSEAEVDRINSIEAERDAAIEDAAKLRSDLGLLAQEIAAGRTKADVLDNKEKQVAELSGRRDAARAERERAQLIAAQSRAEFDRSTQAAAILASTKDDRGKHLDALAGIKELEAERIKRQAVRDSLSRLDAEYAKNRIEAAGLKSDIERFSAAKKTVENLRPAAEKQAGLEKEQAELRTVIAASNPIAERIGQIESELIRLREAYSSTKDQLEGISEHEGRAEQLPELEKREAAIINELAALKASLERDQAFQREINNGLCPILSEKCLNLKDGQTLNDFVSSQFTDLRSRITGLEADRSAVGAAIKASRESAGNLLQVPALRQRLDEVRAQGKSLAAEKDDLEARIAALEGSRTRLAKIETELKELGDPGGRIKFLQADLEAEGDVAERLASVQKHAEKILSERNSLADSLDGFTGLDDKFSELTRLRDNTIEGFRAYIANEAAAAMLSEIGSRSQAASEALEAAAAAVNDLEVQFEKAVGDYDRDAHTILRRGLIDLEKREVELRTKLEAAESRQKTLSEQIAKLQGLKTELLSALAERDELQKVLDATEFIRGTLKEAGPMVARNYVWHVSQEATQLFRDISGNAERTLKWTEDYGIVVEEGGYERPFVSLSGGEQMAAALSVRLALLKQLSDIRIAFFDEPTTNLDEERRENLAQQIARIHDFDQLFVVSHDDTFEGYMDHEMTVEK